MGCTPASLRRSRSALPIAPTPTIPTRSIEAPLSRRSCLRRRRRRAGRRSASPSPRPSPSARPPPPPPPFPPTLLPVAVLACAGPAAVLVADPLPGRRVDLVPRAARLSDIFSCRLLGGSPPQQSPRPPGAGPFVY